MKKILRNLLLIAGAYYGRQYAKKSLYVISGYAAKVLCSGIFGSGRKARHIFEEDLDFFPVNLSRYKVNFKDKSVSVTFLGMAKQTVVYRPGLGGVLIKGDQPHLPSHKPAKIPSLSLHELRGTYWPKGNLIHDEYSHLDWNKNLAMHMNQWFDREGEEKLQKTTGVAIVHRDQLIYENYGKGFDAYTPLPGWSMTKSLFNALVGILVKENRLDIHAPTGLIEWQDDERKNITVNHLLQMNSGLSWTEHYMGVSTVTRMLFLEQDIAEFSIKRRLVRQPGKKWAYASCGSNIISELIRRKFNNNRKYWQFPYHALFHKINSYSFFMETDRKGTLVGSSYGFGTLRDWARFGMLYLNDGVWEGERILPEGWVNYTMTPAEGSKGEYGAHFWLNRSGTLLPDAPRDTLIAQGYDGQRIFIIPSRELVAVRTGFSKDRFDYNGFIKDVLEQVPSTKKVNKQEILMRN